MYRVIVVDDEPMMLEGWQTMVDWATYGFELCGLATDGQEGLELARELRPDLLITDISMPILDGIGLIQALRKEPNLSMRTIIVSGYSEFDYVKQALQCEVDHYVLKPVLGEEMHEILAELKVALDHSHIQRQQMQQETEAAVAAAILRLLRAEEATIPAYIIRLLGIQPEHQLRIIVGAASEEEQPAQRKLVATSTDRQVQPIAGATRSEADRLNTSAQPNEQIEQQQIHSKTAQSASVRHQRGSRKREEVSGAILKPSYMTSAQRLTEGTAAMDDAHYNRLNSGQMQIDRASGSPGEHLHGFISHSLESSVVQPIQSEQKKPDVQASSDIVLSKLNGELLHRKASVDVQDEGEPLIHDAVQCPLPGKTDEVQSKDPMIQLAAACRSAGHIAWTFADSPEHTGLLLITEPLGGRQLSTLLEQCKEIVTSASFVDLTAYQLYCSRGSQQVEELPGLYARAMELRRCSGSAAGIIVDEDLKRERQPMPDYRLDEVQECALHLLQWIQQGNHEQIRDAVDQLPKRWGGQEVPDSILRVLIRHLLSELLHRAQRREAAGAIDSASCLRLLLGSQADDPADWSLHTLKRLCLRASEYSVSKPRSNKGTAADIISEAKRYMQEHYREKIQLQELAQRFNLNAVYFGQQFKRELGCSFNDYVHRLRIEEAQKLLRRTDMKVAEIAALLGYHDSDYFTNKYKTLTGELPSVYKSRWQG